MSTAQTPDSASEQATDEAIDAEAAARRALGIAMNSVWGGTEIPSLPTLPAQLVTEAKALLRERVPAGHERELAIDLLDRSVVPGHPR